MRNHVAFSILKWTALRTKYRETFLNKMKKQEEKIKKRSEERRCEECTAELDKQDAGRRGAVRISRYHEQGSLNRPWMRIYSHQRRRYPEMSKEGS
jgi:uncharacterized paraquat-inducible protein A